MQAAADAAAASASAALKEALRETVTPQARRRRSLHLRTQSLHLCT